MIDERQQIEQDLNLLTGGNHLPWEVWTSNSYRRITSASGGDGDVLCGTVHRDGQPDLSMSEEALQALVRIVNALPALLNREQRLRERLERRLERTKEKSESAEDRKSSTFWSIRAAELQEVLTILTEEAAGEWTADEIRADLARPEVKAKFKEAIEKAREEAAGGEVK